MFSGHEITSLSLLVFFLACCGVAGGKALFMLVPKVHCPTSAAEPRSPLKEEAGV